MLGACQLAQGVNLHVIAMPLRTVCGADGSMSGVSRIRGDSNGFKSQLGRLQYLPISLPMLRVRNAFVTSQRLQRLYSGGTHGSTSTRTTYLTPGRSAALVATATAMSLWYLSNYVVHNDAPHTLPPNVSSAYSKRINSTGVDEDGLLCAVVWGSNK